MHKWVNFSAHGPQKTFLQSCWAVFNKKTESIKTMSYLRTKKIKYVHTTILFGTKLTVVLLSVLFCLYL